MRHASRWRMSLPARIPSAVGGGTASVVVPAGLLLLRLASEPIASLHDELIRNGLDACVCHSASAIAVTAFGYTIGRGTECCGSSPRPIHSPTFSTGARSRTGSNPNGRARADGLPPALMIDLDGFKRVNDPAATQPAIASCGVDSDSSTLRGSDYGARWGGDEFMILAPHTTRNAAVQLAERVSGRIGQHGRTITCQRRHPSAS